jgi:ribulose-phosphate 3-epimerase
MHVKIAPSILTADLGRLAEEIGAAEEGGADWIHLDVMDGHFVPNITIGPLIASAVRSATSLPLDAHLMIEEPDRYIPAFREAGVEWITVHVETCPHLHRTVEKIKELGGRAGVALNPATPVEAVGEILPFVDLILVMSVNPGFGGQRFIERSLQRIRRIRDLIEAERAGEVELQVDGGVGVANICAVAEAGASVVVAGSAVYNREASAGENLRRLREAAG